MEESSDVSEKINPIWYVFPLAVLAVLVAGYFIFAQPAATGQAVTPTKGPVMYFYSEACHYCQQEKPIVERLMNESYDITLMDVGTHPEYWQNYSIQGTPTFIASDGERHVGYLDYAPLKEWLDQHGAKAI